MGHQGGGRRLICQHVFDKYRIIKLHVVFIAGVDDGAYEAREQQEPQEVRLHPDMVGRIFADGLDHPLCPLTPLYRQGIYNISQKDAQSNHLGRLSRRSIRLTGLRNDLPKLRIKSRRKKAFVNA